MFDQQRQSERTSNTREITVVDEDALRSPLPTIGSENRTDEMQKHAQTSNKDAKSIFVTDIEIGSGAPLSQAAVLKPSG